MKEALVFVLFLGVVVGSLWFGVRWQEQKEEQSDTRPSIGTLQSASLEVSEAGASDGEAAAQEEKEGAQAETALIQPKPEEMAKLNIKAMNGGAAKGAAGKLQTFLKTAGYTQASVGNTVGDYTGVTVYYLEGFQASAEGVKQALVKEYPNAEIKPAPSDKVEQGSASVVVIVGK
jgi:hypothetical protein